MNDLQHMTDLHAGGNLVQQPSPFASLPSHQNNSELPLNIIHQWVKPYYMNVGSGNDEWIEPFINIKPLITHDLTTLLLGDSNWQTRKVGAYLAAVNNYTDLIDIIGSRFLKNEQYQGRMYALVLASFNTSKSIDYLDNYLLYYLKKPELHYDQQSAMEALLYLDTINGTNHCSRHFPNWIQLRQQWLHVSGLSLQYYEEQLSLLKILQKS
ncbi:DUF6000 family protein [Chitinophaga flava]|nr:DUF6000 family protein [Chitinophaga flava]